MMKISKILSSEKGFTLVEILVSLAILGIIAVTFLAVFSGMFANITDAGSESKAMFGIQQELENAITETGIGNTGLDIRFNGADMTVRGRIIAKPVPSGDMSDPVSVFIPND